MAAAAEATTVVSAPPTTAKPGKTMEELLKEIEELKTTVENTTKALEKIEASKKKAAANRDRSVEGRTQVKGLSDRVADLEKQMNNMTKDSDPSYPGKKFDKAKKGALKTLTSLSKDLNHADKHLEKVTNAATAADKQKTDGDKKSKGDSKKTDEKEDSKGISGLVTKDPLIGKSKRSSKKSKHATPPATNESLSQGSETIRSKSKEASDSEHDSNVGKSSTEDEGENVSDSEGVNISDDEDVHAKALQKPLSIMHKPIEPPQRKPLAEKVSDIDSDNDESERSNESDAIKDNRALMSHLEQETISQEPIKENAKIQSDRSLVRAVPQSNAKALVHKTEVPPTVSPQIKRTPAATLPPPKPAESPRIHKDASTKRDADENEEDSYFEEEEEEEEDHIDHEEEEEELRRLRKPSAAHEEVESDHEHDDHEEEDDEARLVNAHVQQLQMNKYLPGTQFVATHDFAGEQTGDLPLRRGDQLALVEQRAEEWWVFKNVATQQDGLVPISHIQILSKQAIRRRAKPNTSAATLVDAFKAKKFMPIGFIPSDLADLLKYDEYQLWQCLVPRMTESNLSFVDLHWRSDLDKLHVQDVIHQKILTLKECVKIPRIKGDEVKVLGRCVRVCLCDGLDIISNIHSIRAHVPSKLSDQAVTEDWSFYSSDANSLIDEQCQVLLRSNVSKTGQNLKVLIELAVLCQSTVTQEKCEVGCGWLRIPLDDENPPLITDTKNYNELLNGGHTDDPDVLLNPQYKTLKVTGIGGAIDRFKRARIKFSIESREDDVDLLYDNLPIQSIVVPLNLVRILVFFRNELAYQIHKRHHPTDLSTTPINSIFLSTFSHALAQPDILHTLHRLFMSQRKRLPSSASIQQQRELFIKIYETFIYPLLQYRQLLDYDFYDIPALSERRKLINEMVKRQLPKGKKLAENIVSILLDSNLTDKWTPFTTDEICFTLQKYIPVYAPEIVD